MPFPRVLVPVLSSVSQQLKLGALTSPADAGAMVPWSWSSQPPAVTQNKPLFFINHLVSGILLQQQKMDLRVSLIMESSIVFSKSPVFLETFKSLSLKNLSLWVSQRQHKLRTSKKLFFLLWPPIFSSPSPTCFYSCRVSTQGLMLARQAICHLSHTPSPFYFSYFPDRVWSFLTGASLGTQSSYLCFLSIWDYSHISPYTAYVKMGSP
jgi:hypothetical protein